VTYLFAAYVAIWCILFVYLYTIHSRQSALEKTTEALLRRLEEAK
jgi:CcmD family protein